MRRFIVKANSADEAKEKVRKYLAKDFDVIKPEIEADDFDHTFVFEFIEEKDVEELDKIAEQLGTDGVYNAKRKLYFMSTPTREMLKKVEKAYLDWHERKFNVEKAKDSVDWPGNPDLEMTDWREEHMPYIKKLSKVIHTNKNKILNRYKNIEMAIAKDEDELCEILNIDKENPSTSDIHILRYFPYGWFDTFEWTHNFLERIPYTAAKEFPSFIELVEDNLDEKLEKVYPMNIK